MNDSKKFSKRLKYCELVDEDDPFYKLEMAKYKIPRKKGEKYKMTAKKKSETLSYVLELTIREWINESGVKLHNRIMKYEFNDSSAKRKFKEIDYVIKTKHLIIGEIKVSSNVEHMIKEAASQLIFSKNCLKKNYANIELQMIIVDINNEENSDFKFNENYKNVSFKKTTINETNINVLILKAKDIFEWGVKIGFIETPELYEAAMEENEIVKRIKLYKEKIKDLQSHLEFSEWELELLIKGWVFIENINGFKKEKLKSYFSDKRKTITVESYESTMNYYSFSDEVDLIIFQIYNELETVEINLIDLEAAFHKISKEERKQLENIVWNNGKSFLTKDGRRKFYLPKDFDNPNNQGFNALMEVINNIDFKEYTISSEDLLIIDNKRIIHKTKK